MKTFKEFDAVKYHGSSAARLKWKKEQGAKAKKFEDQLLTKLKKMDGPSKDAIDWKVVSQLYSKGKSADHVASFLMKTFKESENLTEIKSILNYKGNGEKFSPAMLAKLKAEYAKIEKINPEGPGYKKMKAIMAKMSQEQLQQIVDAKIKFLQYTAADLMKK